MLSIGITTFKRRLKSVEDMVSYLKSCDKNIIINLAVNGEVAEDFDEDYRKNILTICLQYDNVFPFFYQEFRSLSKLWNNLIISSKTEYNLILNDDLIFGSSGNIVALAGRFQGGCGVDCLDGHTFHPLCPTSGPGR
ncbi:MAG: hypothetical protein NTY17_00340, partial [Planctomycetia bacterium]|nr:hypothetical protein [Planctomycetia bacterium]